MHRMILILPKKTVQKLDQYRELESRNTIIRKAIREFIIKHGMKT